MSKEINVLELNDFSLSQSSEDEEGDESPAADQQVSQEYITVTGVCLQLSSLPEEEKNT